MAVRLGAMRRF
uniref:Uncharacterized protein n=1 Tax=Anguilla anguilla TaxID=7936 RepID=A0A0E9UW01_ANGAN